MPRRGMPGSVRRALFAFLTAALTLLAIEALALLAFLVVHGAGFSLDEVRSRRHEVLRRASEPPPGAQRPEVWHQNRADSFILHPFLGAVFLGDSRNPQRLRYHWWIPRLEEPSLDDPGSVYVAMVGGSVAGILVAGGWDLIEARLQEVPAFAGRRIQLLDMTAPGNKQPQQLMAVAYLLSLGARIDVLVNLDGLNEVGLELLNNLESEVFPAYPWTWVPLTKDFRSPGEIARLGDLYAVRRLRATWARVFEPLSFSVAANFVWEAAERRLERAEFDALAVQVDPAGLPLVVRGPPFEGTRTEGFELGVEIWANASRALQHLAEGSGFVYFHLLQPNQYLDGVKRYTRLEETQRRRREDLKELVPRWYPELRARGRELAAEGIRFRDLTGVFQGFKGEAYVDDCCHLTRVANRLLAREIGLLLAAELAASPPPDRAGGERARDRES